MHQSLPLPSEKTSPVPLCGSSRGLRPAGRRPLEDLHCQLGEGLQLPCNAEKYGDMEVGKASACKSEGADRWCMVRSAQVRLFIWYVSPSVFAFGESTSLIRWRLWFSAFSDDFRPSTSTQPPLSDEGATHGSLKTRARRVKNHQNKKAPPDGGAVSAAD